MGGGRAEVGGVRGAVDVDIAGAGVGVGGIQPVQTEDTRQNGILWRARAGPGTHGDAGAEQGVQRGIFPVLGTDAETPGGCAPGTFLKADTGCTGGDGGAEENGAVLIPEDEFLSLNADVDGGHAVLRIGKHPRPIRRTRVQFSKVWGRSLVTRRR